MVFCVLLITGETAAQSPEPVTVYWLFAHPDDETLAAGGAIAASVRAGNQNVVVFLSSGEHSAVGPRRNLTRNQVRTSRASEASDALKAIGVDQMHFLGRPEGSFDEAYVSLIIRVLLSRSNGKAEFAGHSPKDQYLGMQCGHIDHCVIGRALRRAWLEGLIAQPTFYRIGHLMGGPLLGSCSDLDAIDRRAKSRMIAAYGVFDPERERFAIGAQSVPEALENASYLPECTDSP